MILAESSELFKKHKAGVVMPTYNNAQTLEKVLRGVLVYTTNVIVVNDGATDDTAKVLQKFPEIVQVSYPVNQGKGYALQRGFQRALEAGCDYVITIDSDGQHYPEDLPGFLRMLEHHPSAIIIGARNMEQSSVPGKSSFGNKFSTFWFWVETGLKMKDTQSGYRLYPIKLLREIKFLTRKFEFEIEVLVRSAWKGIEITEVPVNVFYPEKGKRISHFRPFTDFFRISILNTFLVFISILYVKPRDFFRNANKRKFWSAVKEQLFHPGESDRVKAFSIGFGIFMGIVPLWGFQLVTAVALSFLFRLNKALVIVAANISIPPMIPLILFLSYVTGAIWTGDKGKVISLGDPITLDVVQNNSLQYILGAFTLALVGGVFSATLTYLGLKALKSRKS
jgi:glycosyltransferase involved in cell wall biosynthesis